MNELVPKESGGEFLLYQTKDGRIRIENRPPSGKSQMLSEGSFLEMASKRFPLPWSVYVRLLSVENENARDFYETEALRGGLFFGTKG